MPVVSTSMWVDRLLPAEDADDAVDQVVVDGAADAAVAELDHAGPSVLTIRSLSMPISPSSFTSTAGPDAAPVGQDVIDQPWSCRCPGSRSPGSPAAVRCREGPRGEQHRGQRHPAGLAALASNW